MNYKEYLKKKLSGWESKTGPNGLSWETWKEIAELAAQVNWQCEFKNNSCKSTRSEFSPYKDEKCCCEKCASAYGYLQVIPVGQTNTVLNLFDSELGFWRPNTGCSLPIQWRSVTCLGFYCSIGLVSKKEEILKKIIDLIYFRKSIKSFPEYISNLKEQLENEGLLKCNNLTTDVVQ